MDVFLEVVSAGAMFASFVMIIWRMICNAGIKLKKRIDIDVKRESYVPDNKENFKVFLYAFLFRVFIVVVGFCIYCIFVESGNQIKYNQIADIWRRWDAEHYIRISNGYDFYVEGGDYVTLAFFPLYPLLLKIVNIIIPHITSAGLVTSAICTSLACVFLYKLVSIDYGKKVAQKAVILMNIFPFGFFFGAIMSEGVFLLTSIMTLYYIRKHNWIVAGITGMFAALSRSVRSVFDISSNSRIYRRV